MERSDPWTEFKLCLGLLTRLPVRVDAPAETGGLARACRWFPAVGALIGALSAAVLYLGEAVGLPDLATAMIAIGFSILLTGALHEDGLADVADGFGGGVGRDAKLTIMRDSRIGAYGVIALILSIGLRWASLVALMGVAVQVAALAMIVGAATSRLTPLLLMYRLPPARSDGMAVNAGKPDDASVRIAVALALASLLFLPSWQAMLATAVAVLAATAAIEGLSRRQIGGQTGDVLGASQQTTEILVLLCLVAAVP